MGKGLQWGGCLNAGARERMLMGGMVESKWRVSGE